MHEMTVTSSTGLPSEAARVASLPLTGAALLPAATLLGAKQNSWASEVAGSVELPIPPNLVVIRMGAGRRMCSLYSLYDPRLSSVLLVSAEAVVM